MFWNVAFVLLAVGLVALPCWYNLYSFSFLKFSKNGAQICPADISLAYVIHGIYCHKRVTFCFTYFHVMNIFKVMSIMKYVSIKMINIGLFLVLLRDSMCSCVQHVTVCGVIHYSFLMSILALV